MYNAMNPVAPRPYTASGQGYKREDESEQKTQDSLQQNSGRGQGQGQNNQNNRQQEPKTIARGKASDVVKPKKPVRRHIEPRPNPRSSEEQNKINKPVTKPVVKPISQPVNNIHQQPVQQKVQTPPMRPAQQPVAQQPVNQQNNIQPQVYEAENPAPDSRPMAATSNKVNIAQILKDFRNTISAIGTPDILREEVEDYLQEIEVHTKGEAPSINFVQTNLLNAAAILDRYISETLNKESKVVVKWLEALFLQRINYRYNDGEINKAFLVKFPESEEEKRAKAEKAAQEAAQAQIEEQSVEDKPTSIEPIQDVQTTYEPIPEPVQHQRQVVVKQNPHITEPINDYVPQRNIVQQKSKPQITVIPEDNELKSLFVQAKKHAFAHNPAKAMDMFHRALLRAQQINDGESQSKICLEMGKIYDDNNYVVQALNSYNRSLKSTTDNYIKTEAHYSMAQIYDEVNQIEPALNHYMTSISYAGANDNLVVQSTSLTRIANIFSDKYDKKAFEFYDEANVLVSQTDDSKAKGFVYSNTASACSSFNIPTKALQYYADAVKHYTDANSKENIAENYKAAAELMIDYKHFKKAKVLLNKALIHANKIKDIKLIDEIQNLMEEINV